MKMAAETRFYVPLYVVHVTSTGSIPSHIGLQAFVHGSPEEFNQLRKSLTDFTYQAYEDMKRPTYYLLASAEAEPSPIPEEVADQLLAGEQSRWMPRGKLEASALIGALRTSAVDEEGTLVRYDAYDICHQIHVLLR